MNSLVRAGAVALACTLGSAAALAETWSPSQEPAFWSQAREKLEASGKLSQGPWRFMEAMDSPTLKAGEYLSAPSRSPLGVEFDAALLMQRQGQAVWQVRELRMRALCNQLRLQRISSQGQWVDYVGRDDTADKVRWICGLLKSD